MKPFIFINPDHPGNFYIMFYVLAFVTAFAWLMIEGRRRKYPLIPWMMAVVTVFIFFMTGSRILAFSGEEWNYVLHFEQIPYATARSTMGGLLLCIPGILIARKFLRFNAGMSDAFAAAVPLALGVQQFGCLMAGCCVGTPTHLPWAIQYGNYSDAFAYQLRDGLLATGASAALPVHPVQLYELICCLLMVVLLSRFRRVLKSPGNLFLASLTLFVAFDFFLEFVRASSSHGFLFLGVTYVQWILLITTCLLSLLIKYRETHFAVNKDDQIKSGLLSPSFGFVVLASWFFCISRWMGFLEIVSLNIILLSMLVILVCHWQALSATRTQQANMVFYYVMLPALFILPMVMACTSVRPVTPPPSVVLPRIYPGDVVHVVLTNGDEFKKMEVVTIDDAGNFLGNSSGHQTKIMAIDVLGIQKLRNANGSSQDLYMVKPGSTINLTLQNGSKLQHLKVMDVDSAKITYRSIDRRKSESVMKSDIAAIHVILPNPGGTIALIVVPAVIVGLFSIASTSFHPTPYPAGSVSCK
jgi:prolipoprotein diacylglyceryltransferase